MVRNFESSSSMAYTIYKTGLSQVVLLAGGGECMQQLQVAQHLKLCIQY